MADTETETGTAAQEELLQFMKQKEAEMKLVPNPGARRVAWIETLVVTGGKAGDDSLVMEDAKREDMFHDVALKNTKEALTRLKQSKIPFTRPDDFMAEMLKTDDQMEKVKKNLGEQQVKMAAVKKRIEEKAARSFNKNVAAQKRHFKQKAQIKTQKAIQKKKDGAKKEGGGASKKSTKKAADTNKRSSAKKR
eukprot:GHVO01048504.1.p1 GENE.GHVO01048504.1~~GHVO01048504.1.p1  ORF type:complete len:213 (+),score=39.98 GHVO01048504.1:61-639(+)